jgi:uncharacterized protein YjbI with pentapeptide repeats
MVGEEGERIRRFNWVALTGAEAETDVKSFWDADYAFPDPRLGKNAPPILEKKYWDDRWCTTCEAFPLSVYHLPYRGGKAGESYNPNHGRVWKKEDRQAFVLGLIARLTQPRPKATKVYDDVWLGGIVMPPDTILELDDIPFRVSFEGAVFGSGSGFSGRKDGRPLRFLKKAVFTGAKFDDSACFDNVEFCDEAVFDDVAFGNLAGFRGTTFRADADFRGAQFGEGTDFSRSVFMKKAVFCGVSFEDAPVLPGTPAPAGRVLFSKARFCDQTTFSLAKFSGIADFADAEFTGRTEFKKAHFDRNAIFSTTTRGFGRSEDRGLEKDLGTAMPLWSVGKVFAEVDFREAEFGGDADFANRGFTGKADFSQAKFHRLAVFHGAVLHEGSIFSLSDERYNVPSPVMPPGGKTNSAWRWLSDGTRELHLQRQYSEQDQAAIQDANGACMDYESAFQRLKILMEGLGKRTEEQFFYALEIKSRVCRSDVPVLERFFAHSYRVLSNYGQSVSRPLLWLFVLMPLGFGITLAGLSLAGGIGVNAVNIVSFLVRNLIPGINIRDLNYGGTSVTPYQAWLAVMQSKLDIWFYVVVMIHDVANLGLWFLFGLGLRRRFQIG